MRRRLFVGAFTQFSMSHHFAGTWRLPEATGNRGYADIETWVELAKMAEGAKIDVLMLADALGQGGHFDGDLETPIREGIYPRMDPSILIAALSRETSDLGFVVTSSMVQDHPFHFARRMSTLDHLTGGRIGWNIVTSYNPGQWLNFGLDPNLGHDARYEWADEYMDVLYKLWEGSWERDAPIHSVENNLWADPSKVHAIDHEGPHYSVKGPHMVEPSPQGTPVLFQAGASTAGSAFAAKHAEMQFLSASDPQRAEQAIQNVRAQAAARGRDPQSIKFAPALTFAVGSTEKEAHDRFDEFVASLSVSGLAGKLNNQIGFDISSLGNNISIDELKTNGIQSALDSMRALFPAGYKPSLEELLIKNSTKSLIVGTPEQIADKIEALQDVGVDGILVNLMTRPGTLSDFIEYVVPELQRRGMMQTEYAEGTFRRKVFGGTDLLPNDHTGAAYRRQAATADTLVER